MKKFIILGMALSISLFATAQEEAAEELPSDADIVSETERDVPTDKKGNVITPQEGDFAVSIEADPFFSYIGQLLDFADNTSTGPTNNPAFDGFQNQVVLRYFLDDVTAVRARVGISTVSGTINSDQFVEEFDINGDFVTDLLTGEQQYVENTAKESNTNINLAFGYEKRRGYGRVQAFYGGELGLVFNGSSASAEYGNEFVHEYEAINTTGNLASFTDNLDNATMTYATLPGALPVDSRVTSVKNKLAVGFSLAAIGGVEYFFARKMSIGGEFSLGMQVGGVSTKTEVQYEDLDPSPTLIVATTRTNTREYTTDNANAFQFGTNTLGGSLYFNILF